MCENLHSDELTWQHYYIQNGHFDINTGTAADILRMKIQERVSAKDDFFSDDDWGYSLYYGVINVGTQGSQRWWGSMVAILWNQMNNSVLDIDKKIYLDYYCSDYNASNRIKNNGISFMSSLGYSVVE